MSKNVVAIVEELAAPVVEANNMELVDVSYAKEGGRWFLRLFIDKPGGVSLDDCQLISRAVEAVLDEYDPVPHSYTLEVSSPGLDRPLKKLADFERFAGKKVSLSTFGPIEGQRRFKGILKGVEDKKNIKLEVAGQDVSIPHEKVAKAKLVPEFDDSGGQA